MTIKRLFLYICLTFSAFSPYPLMASEYEFSENIVEALQRAEFLWRQSKIEESLLEFENVVLMDETNLKGLSGIFQCYLKMGKLTEAREILEFIQRYYINSNLVDQLNQQLDSAERVADQQAAEDFFNKQLEDFEVATEEKNIEQKTEKPQQIPRHSIKTPQGKFAKAIQLHKKRFTTQAIPLFMEAIMDENNLLFANDHGLLSTARDYYTRNLEANPKDIKSTFILAWIWNHYSNMDKTKTLYEKILILASKNSQEYRIAEAKLQEIQSQRDQMEKARQLEEERLKKDTERYRRIQIANGKYTEYSKSDYTIKGLKYYDEKNIPEAVIHLQGAVKIDPQNPEVHYHYAMIQVESAFNGNENGFSIAKRELETCLNLEPDPTLRGKALELLETLNAEEN
tara:strand:- start:242 stop:1438 length:1197 start_codon:yes stop_codon:yes gene_type:complete